MIVVEGPDGSGKTTLIRHLTQLLEVELVPKAVSSEMNAEVPLPDYIKDQLSRGFGPRLYDRFALISGPIYGPLFGMKPPNDIFMDLFQASKWQAKMSQVNPLVIYCLPHHRVVEHNLVNSDETTNFDQVVTFMKAYWCYFMKVASDRATVDRNIYVYDYENDQPYTVARWIIEMFEAMGFPAPVLRKESSI